MNRRVAPVLPCSPAPLLSRQVRPALAHETDDGFQGRVVAQLQVVATRDVECLPDGQEGLGLFDRVDAEVGFHVQIEVEHLLWIAGLFGDDGQYLVGDRVGGRKLFDDCRRDGAPFNDLWWLADGLSRWLRRFSDRYRFDDGSGWFHGGMAIAWHLLGGNTSRRLAVDDRRDHPRRQLNCRHFTAGCGAHCRTCARLPAVGHRRAGGRALGDDAQGALDDLGFGRVVAADVGQPATIHGGIVDAVEAAGDTPGEGERDL